VLPSRQKGFSKKEKKEREWGVGGEEEEELLPCVQLPADRYQ
jgi:hypothetical protein